MSEYENRPGWARRAAQLLDNFVTHDNEPYPAGRERLQAMLTDALREAWQEGLEIAGDVLDGELEDLELADFPEGRGHERANIRAWLLNARVRVRALAGKDASEATSSRAGTFWACLALGPSGKEQIIMRTEANGRVAFGVTFDESLLEDLKRFAKGFERQTGQRVVLASFRREGTESI